MSIACVIDFCTWLLNIKSNNPCLIDVDRRPMPFAFVLIQVMHGQHILSFNTTDVYGSRAPCCDSKQCPQRCLADFVAADRQSGGKSRLRLPLSHAALACHVTWPIYGAEAMMLLAEMKATPILEQVHKFPYCWRYFIHSWDCQFFKPCCTRTLRCLNLLGMHS